MRCLPVLIPLGRSSPVTALRDGALRSDGALRRAPGRRDVGRGGVGAPRARPLPHVLQWIDAVRARPGVHEGLRWGMADDEIDNWSKERREATLKGGGKIAQAHGDSEIKPKL